MTKQYIIILITFTTNLNKSYNLKKKNKLNKFNKVHK